MNTTFLSYRARAWSGLKRYFVEWRKRALFRREQRMLSDHQSGGYHSADVVCS